MNTPDPILEATKQVSPQFFVVRLYDGFDGAWIDVSKPVSREDADAIWNHKTANGTKACQFSHIDYYRVFPSDTTMLFSSEGAGALRR